MAKNVIPTSEWYERTTKNGTYQKRKFNSVSQAQSRIVRQMTAEAGWTKCPVGAVGAANTAKAKPKSNAKQVEVPADEQPEQNVDEQ